MTTALDIIKLSLKLSGALAIGQTPPSEDVSDSFELLQNMLSSWNQKRWFIWHMLDISHQSTGAQFYTVGPGGDFDFAYRPPRLQAAYVRQLIPSAAPSGQLDFPLNIIETHEEYSLLSLKSLKSFPSAIFYDAAFDIGRVTVWPIPATYFEIHLIVKDTLQAFPTLTTEFNMPPEYREALLYNLSGRLAPLYGLQPSPVVIAMARAGLNTVKVANHRVGDMLCPPGLNRSSGWYSHGIGGVTEATFQLDHTALGPV